MMVDCDIMLLIGDQDVSTEKTAEIFGDNTQIMRAAGRMIRMDSSGSIF